MTTRQPITIYWAGGLFDFKELTANVEIAHAVEKISGGRYQVKLPQLTESNSSRSVFAIRNADLELLLSCDTIVANFDGTDLDSGTVVEFCFAKMVDMPAVLLRTDFRTGSDQTGEPWNLMCSGYPRTASLILHGMSMFHQHYQQPGDWRSKLESYYNDIARQVVDALDKTFAEKPVFPAEILAEQYARTIAAAGSSLGDIFPPERIAELTASKLAKQRAVCRCDLI